MKIQRLPLSRFTTIGIGGECDIWTVENNSDLMEAMQAPYRILGGGSNLVVSDAGLPERIIRLGGDFLDLDLTPDPELSDEQHFVTGWVGAGRPLPAMVRLLQKEGFSGMAGLVGIPATIGGAVWMNAGTRFGEMFDCLHALEIATPEGIRCYLPSELPFKYRSSGIPRNHIVTRVRLRLSYSTPEAVLTDMENADTARKGQPKARTAGCAFKNPMPGVSAGKLIDDAGLKGLQVGQAQIAQEHGNFVINLGGASCQDVKTLLAQVEEKLNIELEWEYELWE